MGFSNIGIGELIMIFLVVMLVFGPKRMPEIARNMGKFMRDFRRETNAAIKELKEGVEPINVGIFDEPDASPAAATGNGAAAAIPSVAAAGGPGLMPAAPVPDATPANGARAKRPAQKKTATRKPAAKRKTSATASKKRTAAKPKPKRPAARAGTARKR